jgi:hypothetical protein
MSVLHCMLNKKKIERKKKYIDYRELFGIVINLIWWINFQNHLIESLFTIKSCESCPDMIQSTWSVQKQTSLPVKNNPRMKL